MRATKLLGPVTDHAVLEQLPDDGAEWYGWGCDGCSDTIVSNRHEVAPVCVNCSIMQIFGGTGLPLIASREAAGRVVRDLWSEFCEREFVNPPLAWIKPFDELSPPMQEVDRVIGNGLLTAQVLAQSQCGATGLLAAATLYRYSFVDGAPAELVEAREVWADKILFAAEKLLVNLVKAQKLYECYQEECFNETDSGGSS